MGKQRWAVITAGAVVTAGSLALAPAAAQGPDALAERAQTPEFGFVRALAIEAYYSDFVAPGKEGLGAWEDIDFNSPLATRLAKEWSWLGIA